MIDHEKLIDLANQIGLSAETAQANAGSVNWRTLRRYEEALREITMSAKPARYFADSPEGSFYTDDLKLARAILDAYDESQYWTITDLHNPNAWNG